MENQEQKENQVQNAHIHTEWGVCSAENHGIDIKKQNAPVEMT